MGRLLSALVHLGICRFLCYNHIKLELSNKWQWEEKRLRAFIGAVRDDSTAT